MYLLTFDDDNSGAGCGAGGVGEGHPVDPRVSQLGVVYQQGADPGLLGEHELRVGDQRDVVLLPLRAGLGRAAGETLELHTLALLNLLAGERRENLRRGNKPFPEKTGCIGIFEFNN